MSAMWSGSASRWSGRHNHRMTSSSFDQLATSVLDGKPATEDDALAVLRAHDDELMEVVAAAARLRREHFGNTVKVNYLVNLKSGLCPENCNYCSQALGSSADILKYKWLNTDEALEQAAAGLKGGASRVCMVSSGRGPTNKDVERVADMVGVIKAEHPDVVGANQAQFAMDGVLDRLAEAVGISGWEIRKRNVIRPGTLGAPAR